MKKNAVVVGFGSIGSRHAKWLEGLGLKTAVVSRRKIDFPLAFTGLAEVLEKHDPEYAVIANETSEHYAAACELIELGFRGKVLIEKPLFEENKTLPQPQFEFLGVAYNLRFHPLLARLKEVLKGKKVIQVQVYVGKYLPAWRTQQRLGYSASRKGGGGVLRDLSHELDYIQWLFGKWQSLTAVGGHYSHLSIDSDDAFSLMLRMEHCPMISLQMNYLDRVSRREILIQADDCSIKADLVQSTLSVNEASEKFAVDSAYTYLKQHEAVLNGDYSTVCSYEDGLEVMKMIEAAEQATEERVWVTK